MEVKLWTLLLVLSCLVHCPCAEETTPAPSTKAPPTTIPPATIKPTTPAPASTPAPTQKKLSTIAPPTTAAPMTKPQANLPTTKIPAPVAATQKPSTPSGGGHTVQQAGITTVSKTEKTPSLTPPKSSGQSLAQVETTKTVAASPHTRAATTPRLPPVPNVATAGPAQTPTPKGPTTPAHQAPAATGATAAAATTKEAAKDVKADVTTRRHDRGGTGTSAAVTSKPSPGQHPGLLGPTAPPAAAPSQASSKAFTTATHGGSGPDPVRPSTAVSKDQTGVQTSAPSATAAPIAASTAARIAASTAAPIAASTAAPIAASTTASIAASTAAPVPRTFTYWLNRGVQEEEKDLVSLCRQLMGNLEDGNCTLSIRYLNGKVQFESAEITGKVKPVIVMQQFEDITKKPTDNRTLITILASCGALLIMIIILAVCASHHRKPYENQQQHLTDELQTVENGYHDNPTLEVMEVQALESEKKLNLNGEFNDGWMVPMDNLLKEEGPDEEDTHL